MESLFAVSRRWKHHYVREYSVQCTIEASFRHDEDTIGQQGKKGVHLHTGDAISNAAILPDQLKHCINMRCN